MKRSARWARCGALFALLGLAGCGTLESLNPFQERETPLPGERKPVFPPGHPNAGPQGAQVPTTHSAAPPPVAPQTPPPAAPARR